MGLGEDMLSIPPAFRHRLPPSLPPFIYLLSSLYHWNSADGTAEASHWRIPFCPIGTPVLFASEMDGGSAEKGIGGVALRSFLSPHCNVGQNKPFKAQKGCLPAGF